MGDGPELWGPSLKITEDSIQGEIAPQPASSKAAGKLQGCSTTVIKGPLCLNPESESMEFVPGNPAVSSSVALEDGHIHSETRHRSLVTHFQLVPGLTVRR